MRKAECFCCRGLPNQRCGRDEVAVGDGTADEDSEEHHAGNVLDRCDIEYEASLPMLADEVRRLPSQCGFTAGLDVGADGCGKHCRYGGPE